MTSDIRPFQDSDRAAIIEGRNKTRPAHHQRSITEWERDDARRPTEEVSLRLCVSTPATAYLFAEAQHHRPAQAWRLRL